MKNLFDRSDVTEVQDRLARLRPDSERMWGTMTVAQMLAHCVCGFEMASGELRPPRAIVGLLFGRLIKPYALGDDEPMRRNSPTIPLMTITGHRDFDIERQRLRDRVTQFSVVGPRGVTTHPHPFFGRLTPDEWAVLMYKHLDHHLREFSA